LKINVYFSIDYLRAHIIFSTAFEDIFN